MKNNLISNLKLRPDNLTSLHKKTEKKCIIKAPRSLVGIGTACFLGANAILSSGTGVPKDFDTVDLSKVIDENADDTYIDDAFEIAEDFNKEIRKKSEYLTLLDKIDALQLKKLDGMIINENINMNREELSKRVEELIKKYETGNLSEIEESRICSELLSIRKFLVNGIEKEGIDYAKRAVLAIIKILFIESQTKEGENILGLPVENYKSLTVFTDDSLIFSTEQIKYEDPVSGKEIIINIKDELIKDLIKQSLYVSDAEDMKEIYKMLSYLIERGGIQIKHNEKTDKITIVKYKGNKSKTKTH